MANVIYKAAAADNFWDLFSENYDFSIAAAKDGKSVTLTFDGNPAEGTNKLVLSGTSLKIKDGLITGGTITKIDAFNEAGKAIFEVSGLKLAGYLFRTDRLYDDKGLVFSGNDVITGNSKSNDIETGAGNDKVKAGAGDDFIKDFLGSDTYDGGAGWDTVDFSESSQAGWLGGKGINVNLATGVTVDGWGYKDKLISIETVRGTNYADKFLGSSAVEEWFNGLAGADIIDGAGGEDGVEYWRDAERGGRGNVTVDLSKGYAIDGFGDRDTLKNIEDVSGGKFNDRIIGNNKEGNWLTGDSGNDYIKGNGGEWDYLEGQLGNDTLVGTKGTSDRFAFRDIDGKNLGKDIVRTYTDGEDVIRFRNFDDIDSKSDLKITQQGADVLIDFGHGSLVIEDLKVAKLTASDFLFE